MTKETPEDAGGAGAAPTGESVVPPAAEPYAPAQPMQWAYAESGPGVPGAPQPPQAPSAPPVPDEWGGLFTPAEQAPLPPHASEGSAEAPSQPPFIAPASAVGPSAGSGPAPGTPPSRRGLSRGVVFAIVGGALIVVLGIAAIAGLLGILRSPGGGATAGSATDAMQRYLTAIAEGDAEAARAYVNHGEDDVLLSDEVLRASNELGGIGEFIVGEESEGEHGATEVEVTFEIGGDTVRRTFSLFEISGEWSISDGLMMFSAPYGLEGMALTINGEPSPEYGYVFPGSYEFAIGADAFELVGETTYRFLGDETAQGFTDMSARLTDEAQQAYRDLVRASLEECLASTALVTPCGLDMTEADLDGFTPMDGTVRRTLSDEGEATLDALEASDLVGTEASSYEWIEVDSAVLGERDGERREFPRTWGGDVGVPVVDFGAERPVVEWR